MVDLIKVLSDKEKKTLQSYIGNFGVATPFFKGIDAWLADWNKNKQRLYHLLGNTLIVKKDYTFEKQKSIIKAEKIDVVENSDFFRLYKEDYRIANNDRVGLANKYNISLELTKEILDFADFFTYSGAIIADKIYREPLKCKINNQSLLQIPYETKTLRGIKKFIDYFDFFRPETKIAFDKMCNQLSLVTNDKMIKGKLCLSIMPMDFVTMSDNAENWSSCMNWTKDDGRGGCYHAGTVEMMNSNNVICAYIEKPEKEFSWGKEEYEKWNSKKWRVLLYVTKDILVAGKSYPYYNEKITKDALEFAYELAAANLGWQYHYGPERYYDMDSISDTERMENNKYWIRAHRTRKHNILFDTKGMYNDMLNVGKGYAWWCYRNKVEHNVVISYSGKCKCLCCNQNVLNEASDYPDSYNERYYNTEYVICDDCRMDIRCHNCDNILKDTDLLGEDSFFEDEEGNKYCKKCVDKYFRPCPDCGALFFVSYFEEEKPIFVWDRTILNRDPEDVTLALRRAHYVDFDEEDHDNAYIPDYEKYEELCFKPLHMCPACRREFLMKHPYQEYSFGWAGGKIRLLDSMTEENKQDLSRYLWQNLKN